MESFLLSKGLHMFVVLIVIVYMVCWLNHKYFKYRFTFRFTLGILILSIGIESFIVHLLHGDLTRGKALWSIVYVLLGIMSMILRGKRREG